ncbi:hypothetical protein Tco_1033602 [Tanacetum coccineum]
MIVRKNGGGKIALRTERTRLEFQALAKETLVESRECLKFKNDDFIRRGHILNAIPDPLLDVYQNYPSARELWKALEERFFTEDARNAFSRKTQQVRNLLFFNLTYNTGRYLAQNMYAKVIGNLMYAMTCTRPDIAFVVGRLSRHTNSLGKEHWDVVNRVFKYLKKTMDYGLEYNIDPSVLEVSWGSKKHSCLTDFTMTAEFVALASCYKEVEWLQDFYGNNLDKVHLSEYGSEAASYELKGMALKHSENSRYRPKASFNGSAQSGLNEREEAYA